MGGEECCDDDGDRSILVSIFVYRVGWSCGFVVLDLVRVMRASFFSFIDAAGRSMLP